ncbi:MAG TPA: hypothetical protein VJX69_06460 [Terriglobales bacterium]|nr:hypothetical protein [Terriglobales bacterium]
MKRAKNIPFLPLLLASLMVASGALAQTTLAQTTEERQTTNEKSPSTTDAISAARGPYIQDAKAADISRDAGDGIMLAQFSSGRSMRPSPPHRGYSRGSYQSPWMGHGNAGHAVIGAAIGFGLGAALGAAANKDRHPGATAAAVVLFGGFGALIGGAVGAAHGGPYPFAHHRRSRSPSWRKDKDVDEEPDLSAGSTGSHPEGRPAE